MRDSIGRRVSSGAVWSGASQAVALGLQLLQAVVAARILGPERYAEIALIYVVIAVAAPLAQSGLGASIIYFQERAPSRIAQVQGLSLLISTTAALLAFASSDPVASYFRLEHAAILIQLSAATIWFFGISSVWQSQLKRDLIFRDVEIAYLVSYSLGFALAMIALAWGFGAISVVAGQAFAAALNAGLLRLALHRRGLASGVAVPRADVLDHLSYGATNAILAIAGAIADRIDAVVIGGRLSTAAFGAYGLFARVVTSISTPIQRIKASVEFPTYTRILSERDRLRRAFAKSLGITSLLVFPVFLGVALVADLALLTGLGSGWIRYAPVLAVLSICGALRVFVSAATPVFMAGGLVRRALALVAARIVLTPLVVVLALKLSPTLLAAAWAMTAVQCLLLAANHVLFIRPVLGDCVGLVAGATARPLVAALVMAAAVFLARGLLPPAPAVAELAASISVGAMVYAAATVFFNRRGIKDAAYLLRPLLERLPGMRPLLQMLG